MIDCTITENGEWSVATLGFPGDIRFPGSYEINTPSTRNFFVNCVNMISVIRHQLKKRLPFWEGPVNVFAFA
jgi:hypothetical protein